MTRIIKASEVKPGMTIRWTNSGLTQECTVGSIINRYSNGAVDITTPEDTTACVRCAYPVTVLSEPAPAQPEEPTEFGARVVAGGCQFVLTNTALHQWSDITGLWNPWREVCARGPVTVIPDQGWTVPADTPVVPDRIEEWPEDDTALRKHKWREHCGYTWKWITDASEWECYDEVGNYVASGWRPSCGPWTRVSDV